MARSPAALRPLYLVVGDETHTRDRFRASLLAAIAPELRPMAVTDDDLSATPLPEILDRALSPSLLAPLQLGFVRGVKELFGRGPGATAKKKHGDFPDNLQRFAAAAAKGAPWTVLVFVADHIHIPARRERMAYDDKQRLQRIEEAFAGIAELVYCAHATPAAAAAAARELARERGLRLGEHEAELLAELLDANLGLVVTEVEKLSLFATSGEASTADILALVTAGQQSSALELAARLSRGERAAAIACVRRLWNDGGDEAAIGLIFQLGRIFKMALVVRQAHARDQRSLYAALPEGLRPPGFAVETVLATSRMPETWLQHGIRVMQALDVNLRQSPLSARLLMENSVFALSKTGHDVANRH